MKYIPQIFRHVNFLFYVTVGLILSSTHAQANILFCGYDKISAHLAIRDLENPNPNRLMRESWITEEGDATDLTLDKIINHKVSDDIIQVTYLARSSGSHADNFRISLNLERRSVSEWTCISPAFGVPPRCFDRQVDRFVGPIDIHGESESFTGEATCDWQYRDIP